MDREPDTRTAGGGTAPGAGTVGEDMPCTVLAPQGRSCFVLVCDHASRRLPPDHGTLGLDPADLHRHIAWDIGAADVTRALSAELDAPAVLSGYSRLLVDYNRAPDDPSRFPETSDGTAIPANRGLSPSQKAARDRRFAAPYHLAVDRMIREAGQRLGHPPAIVSVHSFTPAFQGRERPWHIGILWNEVDGRLALPVLELLRADGGLCIGDNQPYSARQPEGLTMRRHAEEPGLPHILFELRQDLIDTPDGATAWAHRLALALNRALQHLPPPFARLPQDPA